MTAPPVTTTAPPGNWKSATYKGMPYHVLEPDGYDPADRNTRYPLVVCLHQFEDEGEQPQQWDQWINTPAFRGRHRAFVLVPLCSINGQTSTETFNWGGVTPDLQQPIVVALEIVDVMLAQYPIDPDWVSLTGNSMGGLGTQGVLANDSQRAKFAAAMPVDGSCYYEVGNEAAIAQKLKDFPVWSNHGTQDTQVRPQYDQQLAQAMAAIGAKNYRLTQPSVGHGSWGEFYPQMGPWDWLFSQRRDGQPVVKPPGPSQSQEGTTVKRISDPPIITADGDAWSIDSSGRVAVNGNPDVTTANVVQLVYSKGLVYQQNQAGGWWSKRHAADAWADATVPPVPTPTPTPTPAPTQAPAPSGALAQAEAALDAAAAAGQVAGAAMAAARTALGSLT